MIPRYHDNRANTVSGGGRPGEARGAIYAVALSHGLLGFADDEYIRASAPPN